MGKVYIGVMAVGGHKLWGVGGKRVAGSGGLGEWVSGGRLTAGGGEVAGRACPAPTGWWMVGGCWPGGAGGIYAAPYGQAYCTIRIPDKHHSISKEVLLAPLSFFVVSCYDILCIVMYKIYRERYLFITYAAFEKL